MSLVNYLTFLSLWFLKYKTTTYLKGTIRYIKCCGKQNFKMVPITFNPWCYFHDYFIWPRGYYPGASHVIPWTLKSNELSLREEEAREIWGAERTLSTVVGSRWRWLCAKECEWLPKAEQPLAGSQQKAGISPKTTRKSLCQHQEWVWRQILLPVSK